MKNKHKRQFVNNYKWWDYSYLLLAVEHWLEHSRKMMLKFGNSVNADKTSHKMKIVQELSKRIREDGLQQNKVFTSRNYGHLQVERHKYHQARTKANLDMFTHMLNKHLLSFWD